VWGLAGGRGGSRPGGMAEAAEAPICEAEREAPLCPWPAVMASLVPPSENVCRAPEGDSCAVQSRLP
jgi:hypothetical protein